MIKIIYMLFALGLIMTAVSANDGFILHSLDEAKRLAISTKKPMLLIFGAEACKFCKILQNDLLSDPLKSLTNEYIICYLDINHDPNLRTKYRISMVPDSRVVLNDQEISMIKGYSKETYINWLKKVKAEHLH